MYNRMKQKNNKIRCDYLILGAGIFGLYAAQKLSQKKNRSIVVVDRDPMPFSRASFVNQARVHNGYHYPRSEATAAKAAEYFTRFNSTFSFAINSSFKQIYAVAKEGSQVSAEQFEGFSKRIGIWLKRVPDNEYFLDGKVSSAYETRESSFDHAKIRDYFLREIDKRTSVDFLYSKKIIGITRAHHAYEILFDDDTVIETGFVLNVSYSGVNQIITIAGFPTFPIKYEQCEIILCKPSSQLKSLGITVMDGLFFSTMPFGDGSIHSLSSVRHTPHLVSYNSLPFFQCQRLNDDCNELSLSNCNTCRFRPVSAWNEMSTLFGQFIKKEYSLSYVRSLFSMKPILLSSEANDSRPTLIMKHSSSPTFVSVLSGKISTIFDLDSVLD